MCTSVYNNPLLQDHSIICFWEKEVNGAMWERKTGCATQRYKMVFEVVVLNKEYDSG